MNSGATPSLTATVTEHRQQTQPPDSGGPDRLPGGVFTCQFLAGSLTVTSGNGAFKAMLGLSEAALVEGKSLESLLGDRLPTATAARLREAVAASQRLILTLPATSAGGRSQLRLELRPASKSGHSIWMGFLASIDPSSAINLKSARLVPANNPAPPTDSPPDPLALTARQVLEATPGLVSVRDLDGRIRFASISMAEFLGREPASLMGQSLADRPGDAEILGALQLPTPESLPARRSLVVRSAELMDTLGRRRCFDVTHRLVPPASRDSQPQILSIALERGDILERAETDQALTRAQEEINEIAHRLHAAARLEADEAQVREIARAVPGVVAQVYRSPEGQFQFRYLSGAMVGDINLEAVEDSEVFFGRVDERDRPGLEESLAKSARELSRWEFEYRVDSVHGGLRWMTACAHPSRLPDGGTLFNGIAINTTARKRAEQSLQASEKRFRDLYESRPMMMHGTNSRGEIVSVNSQWLETLGYARAEVIGRHTEDFVASGSGLHLNLTDLSVSTDSGAQDADCQVIRSDGQLIDVLLSSRAERIDGEFVGANVCIVDMTERNEALRALVRSEERYRAVVQDQTEVICRFDLEGCLQFANDACVRMLRTTADRLIGTSWFELIDGAQQGRVKAQLRALGPEASHLQQDLRMTNPENRWFQWTIRGFFSEQGELRGYQAVGRDIQDLKELETEIREISQREQERIGHDLHDGLGQELTGISLLLKTLENAIKRDAPELNPKVRCGKGHGRPVDCDDPRVGAGPVAGPSGAGRFCGRAESAGSYYSVRLRCPGLLQCRSRRLHFGSVDYHGSLSHRSGGAQQCRQAFPSEGGSR